MKSIITYFTKFEIALWLFSATAVFISFLIFDKESYMTLAASLIGVTSLIFSAKANPFGPGLMILFSVIYGFISFQFSYYGETITYVGMTAPMAVIALISWLKNPHNGNKSEVRIRTLNCKDVAWMILLTFFITLIFYYILKSFNTANLIPSTVSVATSFLAVLLTFKRSTFFAIAYAANDIVLIILWLIAATEDISYLSVVVCFTAFLANDVYGFINWKKMHKRQIKEKIVIEYVIEGGTY